MKLLVRRCSDMCQLASTALPGVGCGALPPVAKGRELLGSVLEPVPGRDDVFTVEHLTVWQWEPFPGWVGGWGFQSPSWGIEGRKGSSQVGGGGWTTRSPRWIRRLWRLPLPERFQSQRAPQLHLGLFLPMTKVCLPTGGSGPRGPELPAPFRVPGGCVHLEGVSPWDIPSHCGHQVINVVASGTLCTDSTRKKAVAL